MQHPTRTRMSRLIGALAAVMAVAVTIPAPAAGASSPACPATIPDSGFVDVNVYPTDVIAAVDCLTFYGIARGVDDARFDPAASVARWQMALFLARQLQVHGVTLPAYAGTRFIDLASLSDEARLAVAQLASIGVVSGTSTTTFDPYAPVSRWQMALFVKRALIAAGVVVPIVTEGPFEDIDTLTPLTVQAIDQLSAMGIVQGVEPARYGPDLLVSRWQMSLFLTRTLDADGITPGVVGVVYSIDKVADTLGVGAIDGTTVTSGRSFQTGVSRWRVNGGYTTKAAFEAALTLGDQAASGANGFEMWINDRPLTGVPVSRSDTGIITLAVAQGVVTGPINYMSKDLTSQLGVKTGTGGSVKFRVGGSGASAFNRFNWESTVDAIITGTQSGSVTVLQEGADIVWTVTEG